MSHPQKPPAPPARPDPARDLAAALFAKTYPTPGKTADAAAADAISAARAFFRVYADLAPPQSPPGPPGAYPKE